MNLFQKSLVDRGLTKREAQITESALSGKTNNQIAEEFSLKIPTVKFHMYNIFKTLKVKTRLGLSNQLIIQYVDFKKTQTEKNATAE